MSHRGPDESGHYIAENKNLALGHRRLSIIDLANGQQPMSDESQDIWITYNGEIYNFPELKKELEQKGFQFKTNCDTEVIIYLYKAYGVQSFERLNGIFAFGIYDKKKQKLILARDHFGVKPLYYAVFNNKLVFASEIKAILQHEDFYRELDYTALNTFFTFRYNPSPRTLIKGIKKLPPSNYLITDFHGNIEIDNFWNYTPATNSNITEQEAVSEYQFLLNQAVKRQTLSDVPLGLFLSGGIDSAIIGKIISENISYPLKTFTIGFEGKGDFNELQDARETANLLESDHHEIELTQEQYLDFFFKSFYYTEEPIVEPTISALYYVANLASKHVKVVLAGQGADEPLAGYQCYLGEKWLSDYQRLLGNLPLNKIASFVPRNERFKRAAYASQFKVEPERFLANYTIFTPEQKKTLFKEDIHDLMLNEDLDIVENLYKTTKNISDSVSRMTYIDTRSRLSDNLLLFNDKITMANSLEMRVPFLDVDLVKFVESLPVSLKIRGKSGKYIHKKACKTWLPDQIINRKKRPFATPIDNWLQNDKFANYVSDMLLDSNSISQELFNRNFIDQLIQDHLFKKRDHKRHIFALLSFEKWYNTYLSMTT